MLVTPGRLLGSSAQGFNGSSGGYQIPQAVNFDGTNDYLHRLNPGGGAPNIGNSVDQILCSFWYRPPATGTVDSVIIQDGGFDFELLSEQTIATFYFQAFSANTASTIQYFFTVNNWITGNVYSFVASGSKTFPAAHKGHWHHFYVLCDPIYDDNCYFYIDGVTQSVTYTGNSGNPIALPGGESQGDNAGYIVGAYQDAYQGGGTYSYLEGGLSELYFCYPQFYVGNPVDRFIDSNGKPVFLGADGSLAIGTQPELYLKGASTAYNVNSGYAGNLTQVGTVASTDSPTIAGV